MNSFFQVFAACQGAIILAVSIVIIIYYIGLYKKDNKMILHIVAITISFTLLICCTMFSVYFNFYESGSAWRTMLIAAYALADIALYPMLLRMVRKHNEERHQRIKDEMKNENQ